jgi:hypothetical protein
MSLFIFRCLGAGKSIQGVGNGDAQGRVFLPPLNNYDHRHVSYILDTSEMINMAGEKTGRNGIARGMMVKRGTNQMLAVCPHRRAHCMSFSVLSLAWQEL